MAYLLSGFRARMILNQTKTTLLWICPHCLRISDSGRDFSHLVKNAEINVVKFEEEAAPPQFGFEAEMDRSPGTLRLFFHMHSRHVYTVITGESRTPHPSFRTKQLD